MVITRKISTGTATFDLKDCGWVKSVNDFLTSLSKIRKSINNRKLWFRGHTNTKYRLTPTIGREHKYIDGKGTFDEEQEKELIHRFRRRIYPYSDRVLNAGEAVFLARQHGFPTRLLDWTANALYGLYFACSGKPDKPAALWAILRHREVEDFDAFDVASKKKEEDLFGLLAGSKKGISRGTRKTEDAIKLVHPFYNSPRILAQDGAFTYHTNPWIPLEKYTTVSFKRGRLDISALFRWRIRALHKRRFIEELSGLGITRRLLFPDPDGIARSLWETEALWNFPH